MPKLLPGRASGHRTSTGVGQYHTGETHKAWLPDDWRANETQRMILSLHGGTATGGESLAPYFARCGFGVLSVDMGQTSSQGTWGNDTGRARIAEAKTFANTAFGAASDKVLLFGVSQGHISCVDYALANTTKVAAVAAQIPAIDLDDIHDNATDTFPGIDTEIETAYGGESAYETALPDKNPAVLTDDVQTSAIPWKLWYASDDPVCLPSITADFVDACSNVESASMGTGSHAVKAAYVKHIAAFFNQYVSA